MLAIVGGKGGCGKTTTALGLARALAATGDRPLVVDADCGMPNLHTMAKTDRVPGLNALADGESLGRTVHQSQTVRGVDILPAGDVSGGVTPETLRRLRRYPRTVILDCPAGATNAVGAPLREAERALVVSTTSPASLGDAAKTARMAEALDARVLGAVLTRTDGQGLPDGPESESLRAECHVLETVPESGGSVLDSPVGRSAYERLAERLAERFPERNI